jgi:glycosyltransferase involved in cell wall biosynthesis
VVSIIVPVYNAENYLKKCLDSIRNQTYSSLEIILINDGSTDSSGRIIDEYAASDRRIKAIHQNNGGIGSAYKAAFSVMTGGYVLFVDSDDWLELDAVEDLVKMALENDADMVSFGINLWATNGSAAELKNFCSIDIILNTNAEIIRTHFEVLKHPTLVRLYKRSCFNEVTIFEQNIGIDEMLTPQLLVKCNKAVYTSKKYYNVLIRPDSVCRSVYNERKIAETTKAHQFVCLFMELNLKEYANIAYSKYLDVLCGIIHYINQKQLRISSNLYAGLRSDLVASYKKIKNIDVFRKEPLVYRFKVYMMVYTMGIYGLACRIKSIIKKRIF